MKEQEAPQGAKRLCTPTEDTDDTTFISEDEKHEDQAVVNLVVEDKEEDQLMECRFKVTSQMVEEKGKAMKDYLLGIAGVPPSEETPLPHLERHQAWMLLGGYRKHYKDLKTYELGADTFSCYIPDVMCHLENLFKAKPKPRKGFFTLMACLDTFFEIRLAIIHSGSVLLYDKRSHV